MLSKTESVLEFVWSRLDADVETWELSVLRALQHLVPAQRDVFLDRCNLPSESRITLQQLGEQRGLTRERIRQITNDATSTLFETSDVDNAVNSLEAKFQDTLFRIASVTKLRTQGFDPANPLVAVLLELLRSRNNAPHSGKLHSICGVAYLALGSLVEAKDVLRNSFESVDEDDDGVVRDAFLFLSALTTKCREFVAESEVDLLVDALLSDCTTLKQFEDSIVRWNGSLFDKAVLILRVHNQLMPLETLSEIVAPGKIRSVTNQIQSPERGDVIVRSMNGKYGLREWGWVIPYIELEPGMRAAIVESGGRISLRRLQRQMETIGFSSTSVMMYATMHPAFVVDGDVVRLRTDHEATVAKPIWMSPRCYRTLGDSMAGRWSFVTTVDYKKLRAQSLLIPAAVGLLLGMHPGKPTSVNVDGTPIAGSWGMSPYIQSKILTRMLRTRVAHDGQILRLVVNDIGSVTLVLDEPVPAEGIALKKIAAQIGLREFTDGEQVVQALAFAIGLDEIPTGENILRRLQDRDETDLRDLMLEIMPELLETD